MNYEYMIFSGGEIFLYKDIIPLLSKIIDYGDIVIETNLTTSNIYEFADKIDPDKVIEVYVSLHLDQRNGFKDFVDKVHYLKYRGFNVVVVQVMHPSLFFAYKDIYHELLENDIIVFPKPFEGYFNLLDYPYSYSHIEKIFLFDYRDLSLNYEDYSILFNKNLYERKGVCSWKDSLCGAGYDYFVIKEDGNIFRCHTSKDLLGNIVDGFSLAHNIMKCDYRFCECSIEGFNNCNSNPKIIKKNINDLFYNYIKKTYLYFNNLLIK